MRETSIQRCVREIIIHRPCILEAIRLGIINFSALARLIESEVRDRVGKRASIASIKMALFR
ncbi:MAG TPA: ACT domain-containing protein, partial [Thermoprotei archaeon]|nr:ACT domain-containing protein [Thermoprotei archaeon]